MTINEQLTTEFNLKPEYTENIIALLDEGNTIPFIARYRKEKTGAIDDQVLREFVDRFEYLKNLEKRKDEVRKSITEQGKMTDEIGRASCRERVWIEAVDVAGDKKGETAANCEWRIG